MSDAVVKKLKKYLLFISTLFFFLLGSHLLYSYLYNDSSSEAQAGGTISEAIIGDFPHFNPLIPSNDHNIYINGLLYRSLLEYSTISESLESDIASCNLDNLLYIECVLENNLVWSDGNPITPKDIEATLKIISQTKVNPIIASILENTEIKTTENSISFSNKNKDINFLQVFMQPILPAKVIEGLNSETVDDNFSTTDGIYSGRFVLTNISQDDTVGITKITLGKNKNYFENKMYIDFLILNLFRDENHFLKNKNSFNIYNDKNASIGTSIPRLDVFEYTLSQFVASFFNTEKRSNDFRAFLSETIHREKVVSAVGNNRVAPAYNPFLSKRDLDGDIPNFNLGEHLEKAGYYTKKELLKSALQTQSDSIQEEKKTEETPVIKPLVSKKPVQEDLKIIFSPTDKKYNFVDDDNILIKGKVDSSVEAVYINDYKLSGFTAGDDEFFYRLLKSYDSIVEGENKYIVYFETKGVKKEVEEFVYIYDSNVESLESKKEGFFASQDSTQKSENTEETKKPEKKAISNIETKLSPDALQGLSDTLYYNVDGKEFSISLVYAQTDDLMEKAASEIQKLLSSKGIAVNITAMSLGDITVGLRNETLEYDILLIGVNLGYFGSNIFPYFHSSQVANGYNFGNYKKLSVDILLEELKSNTLSLSKQEELENKLLDILENEYVIKVLYTPKIELLVDKNIKNFKIPKYLPDGRHRYFALIEAYLSEKKQIQGEEKGFFDFFSYLLRTLFSKA